MEQLRRQPQKMESCCRANISNYAYLTPDMVLPKTSCPITSTPISHQRSRRKNGTRVGGEPWHHQRMRQCITTDRSAAEHLTMPHMTGDKLTNAVRKRVPELPIILRSGNRVNTESLQVNESLTRFIAKPIDNRQLIDLISRMLFIA